MHRQVLLCSLTLVFIKVFCLPCWDGSLRVLMRPQLGLGSSIFEPVKHCVSDSSSERENRQGSWFNITHHLYRKNDPTFSRKSRHITNIQRAVYIINPNISEGDFRLFLRQRKDIPLIVYFIFNVKCQMNPCLPDEIFWNSGCMGDVKRTVLKKFTTGTTRIRNTVTFMKQYWLLVNQEAMLYHDLLK